jgi:hypothetical protein
MQKAGREGVLFEADKHTLRIFGPSTCQALIGQKKPGGEMETRVETIPNPGDRIMTVHPHEDELWHVNRQCIPGYDEGGPWWRGTVDLSELDELLHLYGVKITEGKLETAESCPPIQPQDLCEHEPDWYLMALAEEDYEHKVLILSVPCGRCGKRAEVCVPIPDVEWKKKEADDAVPV